jgi:hypothetical protein
VPAAKTRGKGQYAEFAYAILSGPVPLVANGVDENFKGVATVYGSNVAFYRTALIMGTFATTDQREPGCRDHEQARYAE